MQKRVFRPIFIFIFLSFLFHAFFGLSLLSGNAPTPPSSMENVEVTYVDADEARVQKALQIVEQKDRLNEDLDDKAKYLSAFDQKVNKQTVAKDSGEFQNSAGGGKKSASEEQKEIRRGELPSLHKLTPSFHAQAKHEGDGNTDARASQTDDHLKDIEKGRQTLLSTREFVYYSYYARIKTQIRQYWEPGVREKVKIVYKQGRTIASARDRVTQLMVVLDKDGQLLKIEVLSNSGIHDLDEAAVEAFESAAPFPNPPKGMVENDGTIKIRWDFILEA